MFSFFKRKPAKHRSGVRIFFDKEAIYFNNTGRLIVRGERKGSRRTIPFSILEPVDAKHLNEQLINTIFDEAERQGFHPITLAEFHGVTLFNEGLEGFVMSIVPEAQLLTNELSPGETEWSYDVLVRPGADQDTEPYVRRCILRDFHNVQFLINPTVVSALFNAVRDELVIPIALERVNYWNVPVTDQTLEPGFDTDVKGDLAFVPSPASTKLIKELASYRLQDGPPVATDPVDNTAEGVKSDLTDREDDLPAVIRRRSRND